jgi:acetyltransferase-like isoleucine patch superfamily enzyme
MKGRVVAGLRRVIRYFDEFYQAHRDDDARSPGRFSMGRHSYGTPRVIATAWDTGRLRIGAFCSVAEDVTFLLGGNHRPDRVSTYPFRIKFGLADANEDGVGASKGDIEVGNDVWIGRGAVILSGVTVGHGAVIGASAVVAGDVRPYAIVVGNPAREVRRRFSDEQVNALLAIGWWDWPIERILEQASDLCSPAIDDFIKRAQRSAAA